MFTAVGLFAFLICLDMGLKQYVDDTMETGETKDLNLGMIELRKVYNNGFVMGYLDKHPDLIRAGSILAAAILTAYDSTLFAEKGRRLHKIGMATLSAGAYSNLYDRLIRGKLIDYIGVTEGPKQVQKMTFNLADCYIIFGTVLSELTRQRRKKKKK